MINTNEPTPEITKATVGEQSEEALSLMHVLLTELQDIVGQQERHSITLNTIIKEDSTDLTAIKVIKMKMDILDARCADVKERLNKILDEEPNDE